MFYWGGKEGGWRRIVILSEFLSISARVEKEERKNRGLDLGRA